MMSGALIISTLSRLFLLTEEKACCSKHNALSETHESLSLKSYLSHWVDLPRAARLKNDVSHALLYQQWSTRRVHTG